MIIGESFTKKNRKLTEGNFFFNTMGFHLRLDNRVSLFRRSMVYRRVVLLEFTSYLNSEKIHILGARNNLK